MQPHAEKVTAFVTRGTGHETEILLFEHPSGGIQLPAGTVEAGEAHADAAAREAAEETGLPDLPGGRFLAAMAEELPEGHYLAAETTRVYSRSDTASFDWASIRRGILVRCHRMGLDFAHISYVERDEKADPPFVSFQITGWVPAAILTRRVTRYFYHFPYGRQTPATWWVETDNHRFRLFWAPRNGLPPIIPSQRGWIDVLLQP